MIHKINKKIIHLILTAVISIMVTRPVYALYGAKICSQAGLHCHKVTKGESWTKLFSDSNARDIVRRLNRMNIALSPGVIIAIPDDLENINEMTFSPFPAQSAKNNHIEVSLQELAWGAYDQSGQLLAWGPISPGKNYCPDVRRSCRTVRGQFTIYTRYGPNHRSSVYPAPNGGAPMPYAMHFYKGFALHGSPSVPGESASHGCVRLFIEDALWLNQNFVVPGKTTVRVK